MQIRQFIQYFEENTTIVVKGQKTNPDGTKKFIDLINMKLKDLIEIFGYYNQYSIRILTSVRFLLLIVR